MESPEIVLYTQPGCAPCVAAKEFLSSRGITFVEKDIRTDREYIRELVEDHGSRTTPTLVAGGRVIPGFDPEEYAAVLDNRGK